MKKKWNLRIFWILIILSLIVIFAGFIYVAYLVSSEQIETDNNGTQNESFFPDENLTNSTGGDVEVVSDVGGVFNALSGFF